DDDGDEDNEDDTSDSGSGDAEDKDDSSKKSNSGGGFFGSFGWFGSPTDDASASDRGDDFTFEDAEPVVVEDPQESRPVNRKQNVAALNRDIKAYTGALLETSRERLLEARALNTSFGALEQDWGEIQ
ncbi:hypothetical protein EGW08_000819, partial [Elysia chlorotica]